MTIRTQLRLLSLIALIIMVAVIVSTGLSLNRLRHQFSGYQSWQTVAQALIELKASALSVARDDPIMMETDAKLTAADTRIRELQAVIDTSLAKSPLHTRVDTLFATWKDYLGGFRGAIKIAADSPQDALNIPDALYKLKLAPMIKLLDKQVATIEHDEDLARTAMEKTMSRILWLVLVPMLVGGALIFIFQMLFSSRLRQRLMAIGEAGTRLGEGDLGSRLPGPFGDEIGKMSKILNGFIDRFESIVRDAQSSAELTRHSAEQLGDMSNSVAHNAQIQSDRILQVGSAVEEMAATVSDTTHNVNNAAEAANDSHNHVRHGNEVGQQTVAALRRIDEVVVVSSARLRELSDSVILIEKVSSVIRDIADQTNLLALNAAIEAARAGEQGRGFAVVADEVRELSQRTTVSTTEISSIVHDIRTHAEEASTAMGEVGEEVGRGVTHGQQMAEVLAEIDLSVRLVTDMMEQIATASEQQSQVTRDIGGNIEAVAEISVGTARDMAATRDAVTELSTSAEGLHRMVDQLHTTGMPV